MNAEWPTARLQIKDQLRPPGYRNGYPIVVMNSTTDIVVSNVDAFAAILADIQNALPLDVTSDGNVTIDDVVGIVSIHRNAIDDRSAWWRIRREGYARFASHETVPARMLAAIPDPVRDELATLTNQDLASIASR